MTKKLVKIIEMVNSALVIILAFSVLFQILARTIFHIPATWSTEIGRAAFISIVFLGIPICVLNDSLMKIEFVKEMIDKTRFAKVVDIFCDICIYFFDITLAYGCYNRTISEWDVVIPTVEFMTYGYIYLIMFIGSLFLLYCSIVKTKNRITKENNGGEK